MRSSLVQRQIRNNISYQESPVNQYKYFLSTFQPRISCSQKNAVLVTANRPSSANMGNRTIKHQSFLNESSEQDRRKHRQLIQGNSWYQKSSVCRPSQKLNNGSYIEDDTQRVYARSLIWDKEKLFQEQQHLKTTVNDLKDENIKLRTRVMQLEQAIQKYDQLIEDYETTGPVKSQLVRYTQEQHLTNTLKKEISSLKKQQLLKEDEIVKLKRNLKQTRLQELEIEKKAYVDETIRLKYLLEQTLQASFLYMSENNVPQDVQDKIIEQTQTIQELKLQKLELDTIIQRLQKQCLHYKTSQIEVENKLGKDIKKLRTQLIEKHKENETLRPTSKRGRNDAQISQLLKEREIFLHQLKNKDKLIEDLERRIRYSPNIDSPRDPDNLISNNKNERSDTLTFQNVEQYAMTESQKYQIKSDNEGEFNKQKKQQKESSQIIETAHKDSQLQTSNKTSVKVPNNQQITQGKVTQFPLPSLPQPFQGRRQPPVQFHEIKWIGETLRYRLRALKIDWKEIDDYIFSEASKEEGFITLGELKSYLMKFPFDLTMVQASLVGRYAIESENDYYTNDQTKQSNPIVKSVLRRVVGNYSTDESIDIAYRQKLQDMLPRYKNGITETIRTHVSIKATSISKTQLEEVFMLLGLELSNADIEYLIVQCILESTSSLQLNFMEIIKFIPDPQDTKALNTSNSQMSPVIVRKNANINFKNDDFSLNIKPAQQEEKIDFYPTFQNQQGSDEKLQNLKDPSEKQDDEDAQYVDQQDKNQIINEVFDSDDNNEELESEEVKAKSESKVQEEEYVIHKHFHKNDSQSSASTHRSPAFNGHKLEKDKTPFDQEIGKSKTNSQKSVKENFGNKPESSIYSLKGNYCLSDKQPSYIKQESKELDNEPYVEEEKIASHNSEVQEIFEIQKTDTENKESESLIKAQYVQEQEMNISDRYSEQLQNEQENGEIEGENLSKDYNKNDNQSISKENFDVDQENTLNKIEENQQVSENNYTEEQLDQESQKKISSRLQSKNSRIINESQEISHHSQSNRFKLQARDNDEENIQEDQNNEDKNQLFTENKLIYSSSEKQDMQFSKIGIVQSALQDELWDN